MTMKACMLAVSSRLRAELRHAAPTTAGARFGCALRAWRASRTGHLQRLEFEVNRMPSLRGAARRAVAGDPTELRAAVREAGVVEAEEHLAAGERAASPPGENQRARSAWAAAAAEPGFALLRLAPPCMPSTSASSSVSTARSGTWRCRRGGWRTESDGRQACPPGRGSEWCGTPCTAPDRGATSCRARVGGDYIRSPGAFGPAGGLRAGQGRRRRAEDYTHIGAVVGFLLCTQVLARLVEWWDCAHSREEAALRWWMGAPAEDSRALGHLFAVRRGLRPGLPPRPGW